MAKGTLYLTTPPRAPTAEPDLDLAFEALGADVFARSCALRGLDVRFVVASLDSGHQAQQAAYERGGTPQGLADRWAETWQATLQALGVEPDAITRTSETRHERVVKALFLKLFDQEDIYQAARAGAYCARCEELLDGAPPDDGRCPVCGEALRETAEQAYFLRASRHQKAVLERLAQGGEFIWPEAHRDELLEAAGEDGLRDLCISRPRREWAIAVPIDPDYVIADWFDGLISYLTSSGYLADPQVFERYWPPRVQIVTREALRRHALAWPALLTAAGLGLPEQLVVRGRLRLEPGRPSLSELLKRLGTDAMRFALLGSASYLADQVVSPEALLARCQAGLSGQLVRLVETTLAAIAERRKGRVPRPGPLEDAEQQLAAAAASLFERTGRLVGEFDLGGALDAVGQLAGSALGYAEARGVPRGDEAGPGLDTALYALAEVCRLVALSLRPFLPATASAIEERVGLERTEAPAAEQAAWGRTQPGAPVRRDGPPLPCSVPSAT